MEKPKIEGDVITIPSSDLFLADVDNFLENILQKLKIDQSIVADIAISVSELVNNAIYHGNKNVTDKTVRVKVSRTKKGVQVAVTDEGGGFDPAEVADPIAEENLMKEVGRGIFIIRSLMDDVDIKPTDRGTTTTITKNL
jgi:serine/threonine-protein kinase RsbW